MTQRIIQVIVLLVSISNSSAQITRNINIPNNVCDCYKMYYDEISSSKNVADFGEDYVNKCLELIMDPLPEELYPCTELLDSLGAAPEIDSSYVYKHVAKLPSYPFGFDSLYSYLEAQIKIEDNVLKSLEKRCVIYYSFVVWTDGSLRDIKMIRGCGEPFDSLSLRAISAMPKWIPASIDGTKVPTNYTIPVAIKPFVDEK